MTRCVVCNYDFGNNVLPFCCTGHAIDDYLTTIGIEPMVELINKIIQVINETANKKELLYAKMRIEGFLRNLDGSV